MRDVGVSTHELTQHGPVMMYHHPVGPARRFHTQLAAAGVPWSAAAVAVL